MPNVVPPEDVHVEEGGALELEHQEQGVEYDQEQNEVFKRCRRDEPPNVIPALETFICHSWDTIQSCQGYLRNEKREREIHCDSHKEDNVLCYISLKCVLGAIFKLSLHFFFWDLQKVLVFRLPAFPMREILDRCVHSPIDYGHILSMGWLAK